MYHDEELEKTVLAFLIKDVRFVSVSEQLLRPEFFFSDKMRRIFKAVRRTYLKWHTTLDYDIFEQKFIKKAKLGHEDETDYLILFKTLQQIEFDDTKFSYFVEQLKDLKIKRGMYDIVGKFSKKVEENKDSGEDLVSSLNEDIHKLRIESDLVVVKKGFVYENTENRILEYEERKLKGDIPGIPFGWNKLDQLTGGHYRQDLTIVFSRTGGGKTRTLHNFAYNATVAKSKVLYITIEMSGNEICRLYDSRLCKLHYEKIKKGKLIPEEENKWKSILNLMESKSGNKGFYVVDVPQGCTVDTIEQEINEYEKRYGKLDCIFIDYLLLMESSQRIRQRPDEIGDIAKKLKQLARKKNVSIVTATQANRDALEVEGIEVGTEHISISDQIGHHSNVVLYLYRTPEDKLKNTIKVNLVKYRDGGGIWFQLFADWEKNYIGDAVWDLDIEKRK